MIKCDMNKNNLLYIGKALAFRIETPAFRKTGGIINTKLSLYFVFVCFCTPIIPA